MRFPILLLAAAAAAGAQAPRPRPAWLDEGIVLAGNWEPEIFLRRRGIDTVSLTRDDDDETDIDVPADNPSPVELLIAGAEASRDRSCSARAARRS